MKQNQLQPITADLIRSMRNKGLYEEAEELLKAHYKDIKIAKRNAFNDIVRGGRRLKKHFKICTYGGCKNEADGLCEYHLKEKRKMSRLYAQRNRNKVNQRQREIRQIKLRSVKNSRVCSQCGGEIPTMRRMGVKYCSDRCREKSNYNYIKKRDK